MEKKLTNSGLCMKSTDKHSIYPRVSTCRCSIKFLHISPYARTVIVHRDSKCRDALVRDLHNVLGVMEQRHMIVVAPDEQNLPMQLHEAITW